MKSQVKLFLLKMGVFALPFLILSVTYIYFDPFKVIYKYDSYLDSGRPNYVTLNYGYVAVETFLNGNKKNYYDSFIFGSSRSRFYMVKDWEQHITAKECFHFDSSCETLYELCKKTDFLHKNNVRINNALIIIDYELLSKIDANSGYLFTTHPLLTSQSMIKFQSDFLKAYLNPKFLVSFYDLRLSGRFKKYMKTWRIMDDTPISYDKKCNEIFFDYFEKMIQNNKDDYYNPRMSIFYKRSVIERFSPEVIGKEQKKYLAYLKEQLDKDKTRYKIVISPLYDQKKINREDYKCLCDLFGNNNVFDFSGVNNITDNVYNYYETSHYRPHVAKWIMEQIYKN